MSGKARILQIMPVTGHYVVREIVANYRDKPMYAHKVHAWALIERDGETTVEPLVLGTSELVCMAPECNWEVVEY